MMSRNIQDVQVNCTNIKFGSEERPVKKTANINLSIFVQTRVQTFFFKIRESKRRVGIPTFFISINVRNFFVTPKIKQSGLYDIILT